MSRNNNIELRISRNIRKLRIMCENKKKSKKLSPYKFTRMRIFIRLLINHNIYQYYFFLCISCLKTRRLKLETSNKHPLLFFIDLDQLSRRNLLSKSKSVKFAMSFSDNTLILINESTPLLIKIAEKQWILTNITVVNHSYKYSTANQWIIHWFLFRE